MSEETKKHDSTTLFGMYTLYAELAEQASSSRENLIKLYSGMVTFIVAASVLLHRVAAGSDTMWVLPVLGIAVSLSWMMSLGSVTARLSAKHAVLLQLESSLPFGFFEKEKAEFYKHPDILKRKWSVLLMPTMFLVICGVCLGALICS